MVIEVSVAWLLVDGVGGFDWEVVEDLTRILAFAGRYQRESKTEGWRYGYLESAHAGL